MLFDVRHHGAAHQKYLEVAPAGGFIDDRIARVVDGVEDLIEVRNDRFRAFPVEHLREPGDACIKPVDVAEHFVRVKPRHG